MSFHERIPRRHALGMGELMKLFLHENRFESGYNAHLIARAWNEVSGAGAYTLNVFSKAGVVYVTLSSSAVRSHLSFQKEAILEGMKELLSKNELFSPEDRLVPMIRSIVLR